MAELRRMGVRLTAEGVNQYKQDLKSAGQEARLMSQETRLAMAELGNGASATNKFETQLKSLGREYDVQKNKLKTLENAQKTFSTSLNLTEREIEQTTSALTKSQRETNRLEKEYRELGKAAGYNARETKEAKVAWQESQSETKELARNLNQLEKEQKQYTKELDKMPSKMNSAKISMAELENQTDELTRAYIKNGGQYADLSKKMTNAGDRIHSFSSGMASVGDTLTTGVTLPLVGVGTAAVTTGVRFEKQMNRVAAISQATGGEFDELRQQAIDLGESTVFGATEVAQAQEELASQGFEVNEILAAMPGLLDLASVSGGDMALAAQAAGTAVNQFGLEMSDTAHVADVYAKAAADTNAETQDMAQAMKYVGPEASRMGTSFEEAAAAIGIMSDAGIKGTQAGTSLRTMLQRLAAPTGKAGDLMADLGLEVYDANGQMKPLGELLPHLNESLAGMSEETRNAALNTLFGKESMSGVSALLAEADGGFQDLTQSLVNSDGAAQDFAETINSGLAGTIEEMMGALETAGIEITEALAPVITDLAQGITDLVGSFNELDDATQKNIIKALAFVAAAGPVLSMVGRVGQGVGTLTRLGGGAVRMFGGLKGAAELASGGLNITSDSLDGVSRVARNASGAKGVGGFTKALGLMGPKAWAVAGVLGAGYGAWKLWGEGAYESAERTKQWGTDVGETTDANLDKIQQFSLEGQGHLNNLSSGVSTDTEAMANSFEQLGTSIEGALTQKIEDLTVMLDELPNHVEGTIGQAMQDELKVAEDALGKIQENQERVNQIRQQASDNNRELTASEAQQINDIYKNSATQYVRTLKISKDEQDAILTAMTGDVESASYDQAKSWAQSLSEQRQQMNSHNNEMKEQHLSWLEDNGYSDEYIADMEDMWDSANEATTQGVDAQLATIAEKYPQIAEEIFFANGQAVDSTTKAGQDMIAENDKIIASAQSLSEQYQETANKSAQSLDILGDASTAVGRAWNDIVLDEKTGEVHTNLQEVLIEAGASENQWNAMSYQLKEANLDSNVKAMIGVAALENGRWDTLSWDEKNAVLDNQFSQTVYKALEDSGQWNEMSLEEKRAIIQSNTPEKMIESLAYLGLWDQFEAETKELNAENYNFINTIRESETAMSVWRSIDPETKELLGENYDLITKIFESETRLNAFKAIPDEEKDLMANNLDLLNKVTQSEVTLNRWNGLPANDKRLIANNTAALGPILESEEAYNRWMVLPPTEKQMLGNNIDLINTILSSEEDYNRWRELPDSEKRMRATASTNAHLIKPNVDAWNEAVNSTPGQKNSNATMSTNAPGPTNLVHEWVSAQDRTYSTNTSASTSTNAPGNTSKINNWSNAQDRTYSTNTNAQTSTNAPGPTNLVNSWTQAQDGTYSTSTNAQTSTNAPGPTNLVQNWTNAQNNTTSTNTRATTSTNASSNTGDVNDWTRSVNNAPSQKTSIFTTINRTINQVWDRITGNATGNPSFEGGTTWLGDGGKREPYLTPKGTFGVSGNKDELYNLPRGTRIWPSRQSFKTSARHNDGLKQYLNRIPKFAQGGTIQNPYDGYTGLVGEAGPEIFQIAQGKVSITPISQNQRTQVLSGQNSDVDMSQTNELLQTLIQLVAQGQVIKMDKKEVGKTIYDDVNNLLNRNYDRGNIMSMKGGG